MTLTQMQYFDTLCRYENYTRAAQALFVYPRQSVIWKKNVAHPWFAVSETA